MSTGYRAPLREMHFVLEELLGAGSLGAHPLLADYSDELARSVLEQAEIGRASCRERG